MACVKGCIFLDFETKSKRPIEDGAFAYAADPSTDILLIGFIIEDGDYIVCEPGDPQLEILFKYIRLGYKVIAHNMLFEIAIILYIAYDKYNWPDIPLENFRCTAQMAARAGLPFSLADAAKALKITKKLEAGKNLIKLFSIPQKNGEFIPMNTRPKEKEKFMEYCGIDNEVCRGVWINLPEWKESELSDVLFDLNSNLNGVPVDVETATSIYENILTEQAGFSSRVTKLTNGVITKMTQIQRVKKWAQENVSKSINSCDADHIIAILNGEYGEIDEVTKEILEMRQHSGKSSTGKYVRYINSSVDGYIYGMIISFGAHTGRAISKLLNLYNLPKPSVEYDSMDTLVEDLQTKNISEINNSYGSYLKAASTAIRGMITAPEGKSLYVSDYAAIEARIVFWISSCHRGLKLYHDNIDSYKDVATEIFNVEYDAVTDKQRWVGKQVILGAGYGLGAKGFVNSCARWGVEVTLGLAEDSIRAYREKYEEVVIFWNEIEAAAIRACKTGKVQFVPNRMVAFKTHKTKSGLLMLQMKLPSGRCMNYPDVKLGMVTTPWGARKLAVIYKKPKDNGFYRESTYGGKLTENAVQAIARDIFYYGAKYANKHGYDILFGVYDEVIGMSNEGRKIEEFNKLICYKEDWAVGLPLEAEGKVLKHYQKI